MDSGKRKEVSSSSEDAMNIDEPNNIEIASKKQKMAELAVIPQQNINKAITNTITRTSSLLAPIMLLTGHKAEIFTVKFSPSGKHIASGSFDKTILLWETSGECNNTMLLRGHQNAVLDLHWSSDGSHLITASADKTVQMWDMEVGTRVKKLTGHSAFVHTCCPIRRGPYIVSGSDDGTIKLWDVRVKGCIQTLINKFPVTAVCFSDTTSSTGDQIYSGGIDNDIKVWDWRNLKSVLTRLEGHTDSITGLSLSHDGSYLLSNAMDNNIFLWDIRPFVQGSRLLKQFQGIQHNFEKTLLRCAWSPDGSKISAGSADRFVYIWDTATRRILYKLPGHRGSVNEVDFHPLEPIVASASSDQSIYLGEIKA